MINQHAPRAPFTTQSFNPSVCPSVSPYTSHDQYTQVHSPDASLSGRACYPYFSFLLKFNVCIVQSPHWSIDRSVSRSIGRSVGRSVSRLVGRLVSQSETLLSDVDLTVKQFHASCFLVADTQLYKRLFPSVGLSVGPSVQDHRVERWKNEHF